MAGIIKHVFASAKADGSDPTLVRRVAEALREYTYGQNNS